MFQKDCSGHRQIALYKENILTRLSEGVDVVVHNNNCDDHSHNDSRQGEKLQYQSDESLQNIVYNVINCWIKS